MHIFLSRRASLNCGAQQSLSLPIEQEGDAYVAGKVALLKQSLDEVDSLAARGELPDAAVSESGLKITPFDQRRPRRSERTDAPRLCAAPAYQDHRLAPRKLIAGQGSARTSLI